MGPVKASPKLIGCFVLIVLLIIAAIGAFTWNSWGPGAVAWFNQVKPAAPQVSTQQPGAPTQQAGVPSGQPGDNQVELKVCFPSFGAYFPPLQALMTQNASRPYKLVVIPLEFADPNDPDGKLLEFTDPNGNKVTGSESEQIALMQNGGCDILLNTSDVLAKSPEVGKWITDIGVSDGADKTVARKIGLAGCPGKQIRIFNDLAGCTIAVSPNAVGHFQVLSVMKAAGMDPSGVTWLTGEFDASGEFQEYSVEDTVAAFQAGKADAVAGWVPYIDETVNDDTQVLVNSTWLRNLTDVVIVNHTANQTKEDAVFWFLVDWYWALKVQQEDLATAGGLIADWQYTHEGITYPTNDWTYVYDGSEEADMHLWNDPYGQAGLDANLLLGDDPKGVLTERFLTARDVWAYGGIQMGALGDPNDLIETKYLERLKAYVSEHPELRPRTGTTLPNTSYVPFQTIPTSPQEASQLVQLPTAIELGCVDQLNFKAGEDFLRPGTTDYQNFVDCSKSLPPLISQTKDVSILVTGSGAWWCGYTEGYVKDFAYQRAQYIQYALIQGAGIPAPFITIDAHVGTFSCEADVNQADRWVRIEIKIGSGSLR